MSPMLQTVVVATTICFAIGGVAVLVLKRKLNPERHRALRLKYATYLLIVATTIALLALHAGVALFAAIGLVGGRELWTVHRQNPHTSPIFFVGALVVFVLLVLLSMYGAATASVNSQLFVYLLVIVCDGFSQICGMLFGKRKLVPNLSPGKTWGGFIGGSFLTLLLAGIIAKFSDRELLILGVAIPPLSLAGDLLASFYKRRHNVKDYSQLLPGHGGVLDRFDSLLLVAALVLPWLGRT